MTLTLDRSCRTAGCLRLRNRPDAAYCDDCLVAILEPPRRPRDRKPCPECGGPADTGSGHDCEADPSRAMVDPYQRHAFTPSDDNPEVCAFDLAAAAHHRPAPR